MKTEVERISDLYKITTVLWYMAEEIQVSNPVL